MIVHGKEKEVECLRRVMDYKIRTRTGQDRLVMREAAKVHTEEIT